MKKNIADLDLLRMTKKGHLLHLRHVLNLPDLVQDQNPNQWMDQEKVRPVPEKIRLQNHLRIL